MNRLENRHQHADVVSVKEWLITHIIFVVPVVNIVMALIWAFGRDTNPSKANYSKAILMLWLIGFVLAAIVVLGESIPAV